MYPTSFRDHSIDPESYLNTEWNITHTKGLSTFVKEDVDDNNYLLIYIHGYLFRALKSDILDLLSGTDNNIYAFIKTKENASTTQEGAITYKNVRLANQGSGSIGQNDILDIDGRFYGLAFDINPPIDATDYLVILSGGEIPEGSTYQLTTGDIGNVPFDETDGSLPITSQFDSNLIKANNLEVGNATVSGTLTVTGTLDAEVDTANKVSHSLTYILGNSPLSESYDGSVDKTMAINPSTIGAAMSSHSHGNITNIGAVSSSAGVVSGDSLLIADASDSNKIKRSNKTFNGNADNFLSGGGQFTKVGVGAFDVSSTPSSGTYILAQTNGSSLSWVSPSTAAGVNDGKIIANNTEVFSANAISNLTLAADGTSSLVWDSTNRKLTIHGASSSVPTASTSTLGGVKVYGTRGDSINAIKGGVTHCYGVEIDSNQKAFVNVPWENTTYTFATGDAQGQIKVNGMNYTIKGLGVTDAPQFDQVTANSVSTILVSARTIAASTSVTAPYFTATSDERLKENIKPFIKEKSILDLPIKRFDFVDGPKNQIGCIAQDLQKLYPELVVENGEGYLSVMEDKLIYLLIEEVKELREKVDELSRRG